MKTQSKFSSIATLSRYALATISALAVPLLPATALAANNEESNQVASLDPQPDTRFDPRPAPPFDTRWNATPSRGAPGAESNFAQSARIAPEGKYSGWSLNFTPVLLAPHNDERLGGGADPELKYTLDRGAVRLSAGLRVGAYYAKNLFGVTAMPTLRLVVPVGPVEPYVSFGMGYGWLPKIEQSGIATMSRLGVVFRFSERFALGAEGTLQRIERSAFEFPSFGSALSLNF